MDEGVIDLRSYLEAKGSRTYFGVWGGEGDGARLALPAWRGANIAGATRVGLVHVEHPDGAPVPFFVLDLGADDPRTDFSGVTLPQADRGVLPVLDDGPDIVIYLCTVGARSWYMVLDGGDPARPALDRHQREQLLFFAGECAGLLLHLGPAEEEEGTVAGHDGTISRPNGPSFS